MICSCPHCASRTLKRRRGTVVPPFLMRMRQREQQARQHTFAAALGKALAEQLGIAPAEPKPVTLQ